MRQQSAAIKVCSNKELGEQGGEKKERGVRRVTLRAPYKIILFIAAIFTICSVSSIKKIIKEDARARARVRG